MCSTLILASSQKVFEIRLLQLSAMDATGCSQREAITILVRRSLIADEINSNNNISGGPLQVHLKLPPSHAGAKMRILVENSLRI